MNARFHLAVVWLALVSGCGDGGGSALANSGLKAHKQVARLEDGGIRQLCEWSNALSDTGLSDEAICTYDALLANSPEQCAQQRDACLAKAKSGVPPSLLGVATQDCSEKTGEAVPIDCTATVAALERCQRDLIDAMVQDAERASCKELGVVWTPVPASCPEHVLVCTRLLAVDNTD